MRRNSFVKRFQKCNLENVGFNKNSYFVLNYLIYLNYQNFSLNKSEQTIYEDEKD